jgi:hypothetical protein
MRLMILTNVAVAALAALCFQVGAQDSGPRLDQKKASPAAESNQAATSQRRNVTPERAERPAAEPMNSSVAQPEMKGRGAAKQGMKSATGPKAMPGEAAKKRNAGEGSMHKASAGKQPATAQGKTGEQGRRATNATEGTGIEAETKTAPRSNDRRRATEGGHHVTSSQGEVRSEPVEKLDRVDFSLSTGTVVPSYAPVRPLPERIVEIVPQYRGYDFVMVRDEIVIIEPRTRRIVTILQGEGRSAVYAPRGRLRLTSEQQQVIRRDLAREGSAIHTQVRLGDRVPADFSLLPMPATVLSDVPIVGPYLYFVTDDDVVLVAPDTREVVELIP